MFNTLRLRPTINVTSSVSFDFGFGDFSHWLLCTSPVIVASNMSLLPVPPILRIEMIWHSPTFLKGVVSCSVAISSYDVLHIFAAVHLSDNVVEGLFKAEFRILRGAFRFFAYLIGSYLMCRFRDILSSLSQSVTRIQGQICSGVFSMRPVWMFRLV